MICQKLMQTFDAIAASTEDDFISLCEIANLDGKTDLKYANLRDQDFSNTDLTGFDFTGCDLRGSIFENAKVSGAIWRDAIIDPAGFKASSDWRETQNIDIGEACGFSNDRNTYEKMAAYVEKQIKINERGQIFFAAQPIQAKLNALLQPKLIDGAGKTYRDFDFFESILRGPTRAVILGAVGTGKTCFAKKIFSDFGNKFLSGIDEYPKVCLPLYITHHQLRRHLDIVEVIANLVSIPADAVVNQLTQHWTVIFIDGLDQIPSDDQPHFFDSIELFGNLFPEVSIIISSRTSSQMLNANWQPYSMEQLSDEDLFRVNEAFETEFQLGSDAAASLADIVEHFRDNPQLILIAFYVFLEQQSVPHNETDLLEAFCRHFIARFDRWAAQGNSITQEDLQSVIYKVSLYMFLNDETSCSSDTFGKYLAKATDPISYLNPKEVEKVKSWVLRTGFFVSYDSQVSSVHRLFLNFATAKALVEHVKSSVQLFEFVGLVTARNDGVKVLELAIQLGFPSRVWNPKEVADSLSLYQKEAADRISIAQHDRLSHLIGKIDQGHS